VILRIINKNNVHIINIYLITRTLSSTTLTSKYLTACTSPFFFINIKTIRTRLQYIFKLKQLHVIMSYVEIINTLGKTQISDSCTNKAFTKNISSNKTSLRSAIHLNTSKFLGQLICYSLIVSLNSLV